MRQQNKVPQRYRVYVVHGPSSEWGEGVGALGYFKSRKEAERCLAELKRREKEEGKWSWRSVEECGHIQVWDARELGFDERQQTIDEFLDEMNSLV